MDSTSNNDLPIILEIMKKFNNKKYLSSIIYIDRNINTSGIKNIIKNLDVALVSRFHAIVTYENDKAFIKDTKSANGTYINDKILVANKKYELKNGDKIKVGNTVITYFK